MRFSHLIFIIHNDINIMPKFDSFFNPFLHKNVVSNHRIHNDTYGDDNNMKYYLARRLQHGFAALFL